MIVPTKTYTSKEHSFFDDLVTMLFNYCTHLYSLEAYQAYSRWKQDRDERHLDRLFRPFEPKFGIGFGLSHTDEVMLIPTIPLLISILEGGWPDEVKVQRVPWEQTLQTNLLSNSQSNTKFFARIEGMAFLSYYESQKDIIKHKLGTTTTEWPPVLNFARVIRNACGHGGKIHFTKAAASPVHWRHWTFGPSDNGTEAFAVPDGLQTGDLVCLFEDIHNEIYL